MPRRPADSALACLAAALLLAHSARAQERTPAVPVRGATPAPLAELFHEWRAFQNPPLVRGIPDYGSAAMAAQRRGQDAYRRRLAAIDTTGWTAAQQVDYHLVRAEMNGLDFDLRVRRPWATNPAFYVTVFPGQSDQPAREGISAYGAIELWTYQFPLSAESATQLAAALRTVPPLLAQARRNLTGDGRDLWFYGARSVRGQSAALAALDTRLASAPGSVRADARRARAATDSFAAWLDAELRRKRAPSGVGVANYDWYLRNVQLSPYSWAEQVTLMGRELARAHAFLALEEHRNRSLPPLSVVASAEEHARRFAAGVDEYMTFLRDRDVLTVRDWMAPALRARVGRYSTGPREFFAEVNYRDPQVMRTHDYHWFDLARMEAEPHPSVVRRGALLYNVFVTRTEGLATGWEEMMLQAGMFDQRPRARELVYVLLAQRAARALGDLRMHANQMTLEQAAEFAVANTPRGWLRRSGTTVWGEQHLYLQQPGYGTSYVTGKLDLDALLGERAHALGDRFTLRRFMDAVDAAGLIPVTLIRWEMTGTPDSRVLGPAAPAR